MLQKSTKLLACLSVCMCMDFATVYAKGDLTNQTPVAVNITLSNQKDEMKFFPDKLLFETGVLYKLII